MLRWLSDIINLIYPAECHLCGNDLAPHEQFVCTPCISSLPRTGFHRNPQNPMVTRFAGQFPFIGATGHFFYSKDSSLSQLIQDMKYRGFPSIGNKLGKLAASELFITGFLNDIEIVVPLPMHFWKKAKRGYNQTDRIAAGIAREIGADVVDALKMIRQRKTQTSLSQSQRLSNADNLFRPRKGIDLNDKGVLLVDDICTKGATMASSSKALTDAFPSIRLSLFSLGITY